MAPLQVHHNAVTFFVVVLLVASPHLLQLEARTVPSDHQERLQLLLRASSSTPAAAAALHDAVQERPALLLPPPPPLAKTTIAGAGRARVLGSVPSPGVGH
jgi:hypothetical protein